MPSRKGKVKRTKTFTGCSTCRSRGVKCGEERPTCFKCKKMLLSCGGYGVSLVWPDSQERQAPQRRVMLTGYEAAVRALSDEEISSRLEAVDAAGPSSNLSDGLFGVFPASTTSSSGHSQMRHPCGLVSSPGHLSNSIENGLCAGVSLQWVSRPTSVRTYKRAVDANQTRRENQIAVLEQLRWKLGVAFLEPSLYSSMPIPSREGRELMDYWVGHLGPLMIPTERIDNPFTSIIVPLALSAPDDKRECSGSQALLYSIYALAAFSRSSCSFFSSQTQQIERTNGAKYLQLSFSQLGRSLVKENYHAPEAVLATILMLTLIGIFTDNYSNYRSHIRGGVGWIRSIDESTWQRNLNASVIYQIFTALETLRPAYCLLAGDLEPQGLSLENISMELPLTDHHPTKSSELPPNCEASFYGTARYSLDKTFSITKPILECIMQINRLIYDSSPTDGEIVTLEAKIMMSSPETLHFPGLNLIAEQVSHHHACILHCATNLYFKCALLRLPSTNVQYLVRQSVDLFDEIEGISADLNVSGFLWPLFITACEADEEDLRMRISRVFDKRERLGIANVTTSKKVVKEVWRRRDQGDANVHWHEVMAELEIDILLS